MEAKVKPSWYFRWPMAILFSLVVGLCLAIFIPDTINIWARIGATIVIGFTMGIIWGILRIKHIKKKKEV